MATNVYRAGKGWPLYTNILAAIATEPKTSTQITADLGCINVNPIRMIMRRLRDLKLVHIAGWTQIGRANKPVPLWALGAGEDAPMPLNRKTGKPLGNFTHSQPLRPRAEMIAFAMIVRTLEDPHTRTELAEMLGLERNNARRTMNRMHALGLVFIASWDSTLSGPPRAMFCFGVGEDVKRPKPMTRRAIHARYQRSRSKQRQMLRITHALVSGASSPFNQAQAA